MSESAKDIQLLELKDTITQLNNLIKNQSEIMAGLQKTIDNLRLELSNKQSELDYCKAKLFGASSEKSKTPFLGQLNLFGDMEDDRTPELIEAEDIKVTAHKRTRKKKATYEELFGSLTASP